MARRRRPHQPRVEDNRAGLDHRSGTLDSRVVRRSRKPWIGVPVAICTMAAIPRAGAVTDQGPAPLPPPVAGKTVNAKVRAGTVRFRLPGQTAFVELTAPQQLPIGTTFDTTAGRVTLTSAADTKGATQHAWFYEGTFTIGQTTGSQPLTTLTLAGALPDCTKGSASGARPRASSASCGATARAFRTGGRSARPRSAAPVGRHRPLRRDAHPRRARLGHRPRPRQAQDRHRPRRQAVPRARETP